ncbi:MAG TPA: hypothetical protein PLM61_11230 [Thermoanaerobaculales bacterium]|nr:hypothetical protein [Thermoanaerobaculales bacterium]HQP44576.1 hypothetical protein [Thermoanaerobaculales bacterium]
MKKAVLAVVVCCMIAGLAMAAGPTRVRQTGGPNAAGAPPAGEALEWIDYWNTGGSFYTWSGAPNYMSNVFKPTAGWYPLDVVALEVWAFALNNNTATGAAGVLNGAAVFDLAGGVLARELNINAQVKTWTNVPLASPPRISTGNFIAGLWNSNDGTNYNDAGYQCTAVNWTPPPTEPLMFLTHGTAGTAGAAGPWTLTDWGATYGTVSAASIRAQVNTNVPVELMRFDVE